jgi:hypothetical protein
LRPRRGDEARIAGIDGDCRLELARWGRVEVEVGRDGQRGGVDARDRDIEIGAIRIVGERRAVVGPAAWSRPPAASSPI